MKKNKGITLVALIITIIVMLILVGVSISVLINSDLIGTAQNAGDRTETAYGEEGSMGGITVGNKTYDSIQDYIDGNGWEVIYEGNTPPTDGQLIISDEEEFINYYKYKITLDKSIYEKPIECLAIKFDETEGMTMYMLCAIADGKVITFTSIIDVNTFLTEMENYKSVIMVGGINISGTGSGIMAQTSDGSEITVTKIERKENIIRRNKNI